MTPEEVAHTLRFLASVGELNEAEELAMLLIGWESRPEDARRSSACVAYAFRQLGRFQAHRIVEHWPYPSAAAEIGWGDVLDPDGWWGAPGSQRPYDHPASQIIRLAEAFGDHEAEPDDYPHTEAWPGPMMFLIADNAPWGPAERVPDDDIPF